MRKRNFRPSVTTLEDRAFLSGEPVLIPIPESDIADAYPMDYGDDYYQEQPDQYYWDDFTWGLINGLFNGILPP